MSHEEWIFRHRENGKLVNSSIVEYPVKTVSDLKVLTDVIEHTYYKVNQEAFRIGAERVGIKDYRAFRVTNVISSC